LLDDGTLKKPGLLRVCSLGERQLVKSLFDNEALFNHLKRFGMRGH